MENLKLNEKTYKLIGVLFDVHRNLGRGFSEIVYKDAIEYEFKQLNIPFEREKEFVIIYKGQNYKRNFTQIL